MIRVWILSLFFVFIGCQIEETEEDSQASGIRAEDGKVYGTNSLELSNNLIEGIEDTRNHPTMLTATYNH